MKITIEAVTPGTCKELRVDVGLDQWGDNVVITKLDSGPSSNGPVQISFPLDAETARAISFALAELAKNLGSRK